MHFYQTTFIRKCFEKRTAYEASKAAKPTTIPQRFLKRLRRESESSLVKMVHSERVRRDSDPGTAGTSLFKSVEFKDLIYE